MSDEAKEKFEFDHPVVAVGASAGGVEALKFFAAHIPGDTPASFVILQHLAPDHESQLAEILSRSAKLPVLEADKNMPVMPGHIYVLTPDRYLTIVDHGLFVEPPTQARGMRTPIDHFMRSLADSAGSRSVGVILSGTGSDGTIGLRAIKGAGGVTLAQDPANSLYDGMPRAAIEAGVVDRVGDIDTLCSAIVELADRIRETPKDGNFSRKDLNSLLALLKARTGHDFAVYKGGTVSRRVRRRMNLLRFDTLTAYLAHLRTNNDELRNLFNDMLINVTCFFRDNPVWETLTHKAIAPLIRNNESEDPVRIWVPACSTGEEAFTIAMLLDEQCSGLDQSCDWQVFATDLDADAVAKGRQGFYRANITDDVSPERLQRYFQRENDGYRVKKYLREKVVFAQQNVLIDPPFSRLDLISCRNLLIYLDNKHQEQLLGTFHFALKEGGYLFLGTSETIGTRKREFRTVDAKAHLFSRKAGQSIARLSPRADAALSDGLADIKPPTKREKQRDLSMQIWRSLLDRYAPPAVAVSQSGEIAYFHGAIRHFVDLPEGAPSQSIYDILPMPLRSRAREAINAVANGDTPSHRTVRVRYPDRDASVCIECVEITADDDRLFLLSFVEVDDKEQARAEAVPREGDEAAYVRQLENELEVVREDLQTTVEELETSNEELKASHEEAMAANEELQSANEELETSREELQSLNEELVTVNNQLEEKISEVEKSTDDMRNLLTSTKLPVLFLDPELKISSFTPSMSELVELREGDIGRPVTDLAFKAEDDALVADMRHTLSELSSSERQIRSEAGKTYLRRIQPYRTSDERIHGVVVTYTDITDQAEMAARLEGRERQQRIIADLGQKALAARELPTFLNELCASLRVALDCDYAKILKLSDEHGDFYLVAGTGWKIGLIGNATVESGVKSQAGYTVREETVLVTDFSHERRFDPSQLLVDHAVVSGISCVIRVGGKPWGVIGLHDRHPNHFRQEDLLMLQAAANIAAATVMQIEREMRVSRESFILSLAIKAADMGVWQYDMHGEAFVWDERLRETIGASRSHKKPRAKDFFDMIVNEDRDRVRAALAMTVHSGSLFNEEFRLERPDGKIIWLLGQGERMSEADRQSIIGIMTDITERKLAEDQNRFIMRELDHRVKNLLSIILSIARMTGSNASNFETFLKSFEDRLHAMARTHSLLADGRWQGADLRALVEDELAHSSDGRNISIDGPAVSLSPAAAQSIAMALHELCTNALKYGALSRPEGSVDVTWEWGEDRSGAKRLDFSWRESGGPPVERPEKKGFGSIVIERILKAQLQADTNIDYSPEGLRAFCSIPLDGVIASGAAATMAQARTSQAAAQIDLSSLKSSRILVLDDEWLVADQHSNLLIGAGANVVGPYHQLADARRAIGAGDIDLALLDYNIDGKPIDELLPLLDRQGVPVLIVSGYGSELDVAAEATKLAFMTKPVSPAALLSRVAELLGDSTGGNNGQT